MDPIIHSERSREGVQPPLCGCGPVVVKHKCEFSVQKETWRKNPSAIIHQCKALSIDRFLGTSYKAASVTTSTLNEAIVRFAGTENISFRSLSSETLYKVFEQFFLLGQQNPGVELKQIFKKLTLQSARDLFVNISNFYLKKLENLYSLLPCCTLALDAGKLKSKPYLEVMLLSAIDEIPPLSIYSVSNFSGTVISYRNIILNLLKDLKNKKIKVLQ